MRLPSRLLETLCRVGIRFWYFVEYDDNGGNYYCKCGCCRRRPNINKGWER